MGDRSPKANRKQSAQKKSKDDSATSKKNDAIAAKQVPKTGGKK